MIASTTLEVKDLSGDVTILNRDKLTWAFEQVGVELSKIDPTWTIYKVETFLMPEMQDPNDLTMIIRKLVWKARIHRRI